MTSARSPLPDDIASILAEGIRYERGGVTARAVASFEEVAARAAESPADVRARLIGGYDHAAASVIAG